MAYDAELAERVRTSLGGEPDLTERAMFGGLAFLVAGHMTAAVGTDGLLLRVDPDATWLASDPRVSEEVMPGRTMRAWRHLDVDAGTPDLTVLLTHALEQVRALPPKA